MEIRRIDLNSLKSDLPEKLLCTIGSFDGIHLGHMELFNILNNEKKNKNNGYKTAVFTFDFHPDYSLNKRENHGVIENLEMKKSVFKNSGIDIVYILDSNVLKLTYKDFHNLILSKYGVELIVVGEDFKYGLNLEGNVDTLREQFEVKTIMIKDSSGTKLSSNSIRGYLENGDVDLIKHVLGHNYFVEGTVVRGAGLGRQLGFPTANIEIADNCYLMRSGVYSVRVKIDEKWYLGVTNVGKNPTVNTQVKPRIETFVLDFTGDLYGKIIKIEFVKFLRDEKKFNSINELKEMITKNIEEVRRG